VLDDVLGNAQRPEEVDDELVARAGLAREAGALLGQEDRAIGTARGVAVALEARDRADHRHVRHAEPLRQVHGARFADGLRQLGDRLGIVLRRLARVLPPRLAERAGLRLCAADGRLRFLRGALSLGLPDTLSRAPFRRRAPVAWLARGARSHAHPLIM